MPSSRLPNDVEGVLSKPNLHVSIGTKDECYFSHVEREDCEWESSAKLKVISAKNVIAILEKDFKTSGWSKVKREVVDGREEQIEREREKLSKKFIRHYEFMQSRNHKFSWKQTDGKRNRFRFAEFIEIVKFNARFYKRNKKKLQNKFHKMKLKINTNKRLRFNEKRRRIGKQMH